MEKRNDLDYANSQPNEFEQKYGVAYINIGLYFEMDLTEEQIEEIINEMSYEIKHKLIVDTRINGYELNK